MDEPKMNRDDIIRMAGESWLTEYGVKELSFGRDVEIDIEALERFAALVAAAEREAILKDGWRQCAKDQRTTQFCGMVEQAVLAEREACAKLCYELGEKDDSFYAEFSRSEDCAEAIRARSQNDGH
jgi:hypothetical protein